MAMKVGATSHLLAVTFLRLGVIRRDPPAGAEYETLARGGSGISICRGSDTTAGTLMVGLLLSWTVFGLGLKINFGMIGLIGELLEGCFLRMGGTVT